MTSLTISEEEARLLPFQVTLSQAQTYNFQEKSTNIENDEKIILGKFEYVSELDRLMFVNAWQAITLTENWDFMKNNIESFMWSNDKIIDIISKKMVELGYNRHSRASFNYTMRRMQYVAQNGEHKFKEEYY